VETKVLTAHVPLPLAEKVDRMAARLERSRGWIVKQALSAWIDQEEEHRRLTLEALDDVEAGRIIDHQAVQAGPRASTQTTRCRVDGPEMDRQSAVRPVAPV
jgi:predicted transcriptional regulator